MVQGSATIEMRKTRQMRTAISKGGGRLFAEKQSWLNSAGLRSTWGNDGVRANSIEQRVIAIFASKRSCSESVNISGPLDRFTCQIFTLVFV